jgi:hypothetical protein
LNKLKVWRRERNEFPSVDVQTQALSLSLLSLSVLVEDVSKRRLSWNHLYYIIIEMNGRRRNMLRCASRRRRRRGYRTILFFPLPARVLLEATYGTAAAAAGYLIFSRGLKYTGCRITSKEIRQQSAPVRIDLYTMPGGETIKWICIADQ